MRREQGPWRERRWHAQGRRRSLAEEAPLPKLRAQNEAAPLRETAHRAPMEHRHAHLATNSSSWSPSLAFGLGLVPLVYYSLLLCLGLPGEGVPDEGVPGEGVPGDRGTR